MSQPVYSTASEKLTPEARAAAVAATRGPRTTRPAAKKTTPAAAPAFLEPHHNTLRPAFMPGVEVTIELVTAEQAELMLGRLPDEQAQIKQRGMSKKTVDRYAADMLSERWPFTGDPVRFNTRGELIDGQHRLRAIVLSGIPQAMVIIRGLDPEAFVVLDTGRGRSFGDALRSRGVVNTAIVAGVTRRLFYWLRGGYGVPHVPHVPNPQFLGVPASPGVLMQTYETYLEEVHAAARRGSAFKANAEFATKTAAPTVVGFVYLLLRRIDKDGCEKFFYELQNGPSQIGPEYPIAALRRRLSQRISAANEAAPDWVWMHFFLYTWERWMRGQSIGLLRTPPSPNYVHVAKLWDPHAANREPGWEPLPLLKANAQGDAL